MSSPLPDKTTRRSSRCPRGLLPYCALLVTLVICSSAPGQTSSRSVRAGVLVVCSKGPERAEVRALAAQARASRLAAQTSRNPALIAEHADILSGPLDRETVVGVQVPLVISGRGHVLERAADQRAREARFRSDDVLLEAALRFRELHARAILSEARRGVLQRQQAALDAMTAAGAALASGGESARYDVLRQRVAADSHRRELTSAAAEARALHAELEAWLQGHYDVLHLDLQELTPSQERIDGHPRADHPRLVALEAGARASELEERAARRLAVPEPQVSAGYRRLQTDAAVAHGMALAVTIPLTLFDDGSREAARSAAVALTQRAALASERRRITARARAARARLDVLERELRKRQSEGGTNAIREGARRLYAAGEMSLGDLLAAFQAAESAELSRLDLLAQAALARIELMGVLGTQFDAELDRACSGARQ